MRIRDHPATAAALLLTGVATLHALLGLGGGWPSGAQPLGQTGNSSPVQVSGARQQALQWCREHVTIIHDVYWAAACSTHAEQEQARRQACLRTQGMDSAGANAACTTTLGAPDDSPDCTLPDARASTLNTARTAAEQQCLVEASTAERSALRR